MARPLRIQYPGALYHVTSRGNARHPIFRDDLDRKTFLDLLNTVTEDSRWLCHGYCLMTNHYHLVVETPEANLSGGMRQLNGVYTMRFNWRHRTVGHVLQGRFKAILIQRESHLLEVCRYVVLNPVRAQDVKKPEEWKWSSYLGTAGLAKPHECLTVDWVLGQFGKTRRLAEKAYRNFVSAGIGGAGIGGGSIWGEVKGQSVLGEDSFVKELELYTKGAKEFKEIPRTQRYVNRPELDQWFSRRTEQGKKWRNRKIAEAVRDWGYTQKQIADYLGMHYSTVSRIWKNFREMSKSKT
jgi:REP-associated tyrosine transposase